MMDKVDMGKAQMPVPEVVPEAEAMLSANTAMLGGAFILMLVPGILYLRRRLGGSGAASAGKEFTVTIQKPKPNSRLGMVLQPSGSHLAVVELQDSGLAATSGRVELGDFVTSVNNTPVNASSSLTAVAEMMRSAPKSVVLHMTRPYPEAGAAPAMVGFDTTPLMSEVLDSPSGASASPDGLSSAVTDLRAALSSNGLVDNPAAQSSMGAGGGLLGWNPNKSPASETKTAKKSLQFTGAPTTPDTRPMFGREDTFASPSRKTKSVGAVARPSLWGEQMKSPLTWTWMFLLRAGLSVALTVMSLMAHREASRLSANAERSVEATPSADGAAGLAAPALGVFSAAQQVLSLSPVVGALLLLGLLHITAAVIHLRPLGNPRWLTISLTVAITAVLCTGALEGTLRVHSSFTGVPSSASMPWLLSRTPTDVSAPLALTPAQHSGSLQLAKAVALRGGVAAGVAGAGVGAWKAGPVLTASLASGVVNAQKVSAAAGAWLSTAGTGIVKAASAAPQHVVKVAAGAWQSGTGALSGGALQAAAAKPVAAKMASVASVATVAATSAAASAGKKVALRTLIAQAIGPVGVPGAIGVLTQVVAPLLLSKFGKGPTKGGGKARRRKMKRKGRR